MILKRFLAHTGGNIAILFTSGFAVAAMMAAVAIDGGSLYYERRQIQNGVDIAALTAAADPLQALALAQQALVEARLLTPNSREGLTVTTGHYDPDPGRAADERFFPNQLPLNAVRVSFSQPGTLYFAAGFAPPPTLSASAVASVTPQVSFSIGSRLASLDGGLANSVLNGLLGTDVALTVMDYNGLAGARVDAFRFLDALALELGLSVGTYDDLLAMSADHGQLAKALARVLSGADRTAALKLADVAGHNGAVPLNRLFELGRLGNFDIGGTAGEGLFTTVSALDLLAASASLSDGTRQLGLSLNAGVPGLLGIAADLAVGEPPQGGGWYAIGESGTVVRTAQTRLRLVVSVLGSGLLVGAPIRLPIYVELAHAEAVVGSATCPSGTNRLGSATILTRPGVLRMAIGDVDDTALRRFNTTPTVTPAKLVEIKLLGIPILQVLATALVEIAQTTPVALAFSSTEIGSGTVKTARTSTMVSSLTNSLLDNLRIQAPILGLGLNLSSLTTLLKVILTPITPTLDLTIARLFEGLGVGLGEADVRVYGVRCSTPVLVG